ncbi:MAG: FAD-dependent oxidoreductase, partial [Deltaproteobacteria bacterium]|nr:FAD-dependent oxidoreductase [Deltaproteobacteria bacterium]
FINKFSSVKSYTRRSSVYFRDRDLYIPYPIQNNLRFLDTGVAKIALEEMIEQGQVEPDTMKGWLKKTFGSTLCNLFFYPFHSLYTAGLYEHIAPQDAFKSPVDLSLVRKGAFGESSAAGYNSSFIYPENGLNALARRIAEKCDVQYGKQVKTIDIQNKTISFYDGSTISYDSIISTLPLNDVIGLCGLHLDCRNDPYSSVLVLNIGANRGNNCPDHHWLYNINTISGFHRVGFYSNVDRSFLPVSSHKNNDRVSIYVERAYPGGQKASHKEIAQYIDDVTKELQDWGFVNDTEVTDFTWIDVAYTWSWPGSRWKEKALRELKKNDIYQVGRYARWEFQGISDSIREGLLAASSMTEFNLA